MSQASHQSIEAALTHNSGTDRELPVEWVAEHRDQLRIIDVREPNELSGALGAIEGVENIPLLEVLSRAEEFASAGPLVLVCRSGRRSGLAAATIRESGGDAASVEGGMLAHNLVVLGRSGIVEEERAVNTTKLAEASYRTNGVTEVSASWVAQNFGHFKLVDVREAHELKTSGKVAQAEHVPMSRFMHAANELDRDAPIVVMCASGGRSGRVVRALEGAGFRAVASLEGGMFGWKSQALPVL